MDICRPKDHKRWSIPSFCGLSHEVDMTGKILTQVEAPWKAQGPGRGYFYSPKSFTVQAMDHPLTQQHPPPNKTRPWQRGLPVVPHTPDTLIKIQEAPPRTGRDNLLSPFSTIHHSLNTNLPSDHRPTPGHRFFPGDSSHKKAPDQA